MILGIALAALTAAPPLSPVPSAASVREIEIVSAWGGLGRPRYYHAKITPVSGRFTVEKDVYISTDDVQHLIAALYAPPIRRPTPAAFSMVTSGDFALEGRVLEPLHECVGDGGDIPAVQRFFSALFVDSANQQRWLDDDYGGTRSWTDDYPSERVSVTFSDGAIVTASSDKQQQFMLPFTITRSSTTYRTFEPTLPKAIAAISPGDVNASLLRGEGIYYAYGSWLCDAYRNNIDEVVLAKYLSALQRFIEVNHVAADGLRLSGDLGSLNGDARFPFWPSGVSFHVELSGTPLDPATLSTPAIETLKKAKALIGRILAIPWLSSWLNSADDPKLTFEAVDRSFLLRNNVIGLLKANAKVLAAVRRAGPNVMYATMLDRGHQFGSEWVFLPDGRSVLANYAPGESALGPLIESQARNAPIILDPQGRPIDR